MPGLDPKRVDSIIPGVILVRSLLEVVHADSYVLCEAALREGLVADYAARNGPGIQLIDEYPDLRRRSVVRLSRRCNANQPHAEHVARLALDLFRGLRPLHDLPNADGELLEFAALLHDIGFHVAPSKHHKHSAYLVENADLQGFTADEIADAGADGALPPQGDAEGQPSGLRRAAGRRQAEGARAGGASCASPTGSTAATRSWCAGVRCRIGDKNVEVTLSAASERRARGVGRAAQARPRRGGVRPQAQVYGGTRVDIVRGAPITTGMSPRAPRSMQLAWPFALIGAAVGAQLPAPFASSVIMALVLGLFGALVTGALPRVRDWQVALDVAVRRRGYRRHRRLEPRQLRRRRGRRRRRPRLRAVRAAAAGAHHRRMRGARCGCRERSFLGRAARRRVWLLALSTSALAALVVPALSNPWSHPAEAPLAQSCALAR